MSLKGPIILIENDADDLGFLADALTALAVTNPVRVFKAARLALDYLRTTEEQPFLILADIVMEGMDGLQLRQAINEDAYLRRKAIPFIFITDYATEANVRKAYDLTVQGFYQKAHSIPALQDQLSLIITYWKNCLHPNSRFLA